MTRTARGLWWFGWAALAMLGVYVLGDLARASVQESREGLPWPGLMFNFTFRLIPIALLLFAFGLLIEVAAAEARQGQMPWRVRRLLFWTPRVAILVFAFLVSLFALDVFGQGYGFWGTLLALAIHLLPVGLMLLAIAAAWRWEWVGALFFTAWAVWYIATARGFPPSVYLMMAGLPFALGLLFLLNWRYRTELHAR